MGKSEYYPKYGKPCVGYRGRKKALILDQRRRLLSKNILLFNLKCL